MALNLVKPPADYYPSFTQGRPIFNGSIYVGEPDTDPEILANQKQVTIRQEDGTEIPVSQPILTGSGGVPTYNGSPVQVLVDGNYSIKVLNAQGSQVYYLENAFNGDPVTIDELYPLTDARYTAVFASVADMIALNPIDGVAYVPVSGQLVKTTSYYTSIPYTEPQGGGGEYRVMTLAEYALTPDEAGAAFTVGSFAFVRDFNGKISVKDFGAVGDGVTDDTVAVQAAVDYIGSLGSPPTSAGQYELHFPSTGTSNTYYKVSDEILFNDILQTRVHGSQGVHIRNTTTDKPIFRITATAFPNVFGFVVENLFLENQFSGTANVLQLDKCILSWFRNLYIDQAPGHGIRLDSVSVENQFDGIYIESAGKAGISCVSRLNHFTNIHVLQSGESGIELGSGGDENTLIGCKSYLNSQHGYSVSGQFNQLIGCLGRNNSQGSTGVYSGLSLAGNDNQAIGFAGYDDQGTPTQRYGVRVAGTDNQLIGVRGTGNTDNLVEDAGTDSNLWMAGDSQVDGFTYKTPIIHKNLSFFVDGDTTPDVSGGNKFRTNNTAPTSITYLDGGTNGQSVRLVILDTNTTLVNSASFVVKGDTALVPVNSLVDCEQIGTTWYVNIVG